MIGGNHGPEVFGGGHQPEVFGQPNLGVGAELDQVVRTELSLVVGTRRDPVVGPELTSMLAVHVGPARGAN